MLVRWSVGDSSFEECAWSDGGTGDWDGLYFFLNFNLRKVSLVNEIWEAHYSFDHEQTTFGGNFSKST